MLKCALANHNLSVDFTPSQIQLLFDDKVFERYSVFSEDGTFLLIDIETSEDQYGNPNFSVSIPGIQEGQAYYPLANVSQGNLNSTQPVNP